MAVHTGRNGLVKMTLANADGTTPSASEPLTGLGTLRSWSINHSSSNVDVTTMTTSTTIYTKMIAGVKSWSSSLSMLWDDADTTLTSGNLVPGRYVNIWIYPMGSADVYSGIAIIDSIDRSASHDGVVEMSISLTGHDTLNLNQ
jgi:predicted secreted protein